MKIVSLSGLAPLRGELAEWMMSCVVSPNLVDMTKKFGTPLNIHHDSAFKKNIDQLMDEASNLDINLEIFFARKANKCLSFVEACKEQKAGVDVAGFEELNQTLSAGVKASKIVCSAAVKSDELLTKCLVMGVNLVVDNVQELRRIVEISKVNNVQPKLALRLSGFYFDQQKSHSRFGIDIDHLADLVSVYCSPESEYKLSFEGLHFHLSGYSSDERHQALSQCLDIVSEYKALKATVRYIDIGGGFPVNYLSSAQQWYSFWEELSDTPHKRQLTFRHAMLGWQKDDDIIRGSKRVYPFWNESSGPNWLADIFKRMAASHETLAERLKKMSIGIRCEPGRYLLRNCGFTIAKVQHVKPYGEYCAVSLDMNHTQCKTGSEDYLIDPYLLANDDDVCSSQRTAGYLFGSYCTEDDLPLKRTLMIPNQIKKDDLILLPNTAGYFMHFRESQSHQLPLAKNIFYKEQPGSSVFCLDAIDYK